MNDIGKYEGRTYTSPGEIVKTFASYFSSVYVLSTLQVNDKAASPRNTGGNIIRLRTLFKSDVVQVITKPKLTGRSLGPDNIPPYIYEDCKEYLATPLQHLFNLSPVMYIHGFGE